MTTRQIEKDLKELLGGTYGGPSVGVEDGQFVIYIWYDAPVGMDMLGRGHTLELALADYRRFLAAQGKPGRRKKAPAGR